MCGSSPGGSWVGSLICGRIARRAGGGAEGSFQGVKGGGNGPWEERRALGGGFVRCKVRPSWGGVSGVAGGTRGGMQGVRLYLGGGRDGGKRG
ncbi:hypothetical protein Tco_0754942 [Tanacetum coccineum]